MIEVETKSQEEIIIEERRTQRERLVAHAEKLHKEKRYHIEFVKVKCIAVDTGYYANRIIRDGQVFIYDDVVKNGKFPLWCKPVDAFTSEWSKLSSAEKAVYLKRDSEVKSSDDGLSRELELLRKELEAEKALRAEAEERLSSKDEIIPEDVKEPTPITEIQTNSPFPDGSNSDII